jgi:hypothetical protein
MKSYVRPALINWGLTCNKRISHVQTDNVINTFYSCNLKMVPDWQSVFVPGRPSQPSVMLGKVRSLPEWGT